MKGNYKEEWKFSHLDSEQKPVLPAHADWGTRGQHSKNYRHSYFTHYMHPKLWERNTTKWSKSHKASISWNLSNNINLLDHLALQTAPFLWENKKILSFQLTIGRSSAVWTEHFCKCQSHLQKQCHHRYCFLPSIKHLLFQGFLCDL